ncbi:MAG: type II/IV secretion system protein [Desulfobacterales bacterium]|nr:type II/IV secretion system protein [Desulfobacterales bacterium]
MPAEKTDPFAIKTVCRGLLKKGLIKRGQAKSIISQEERIRKNLEDQRAKQKGDERTREIVNPITSVDVIVSLNFVRADHETRVLDEDIIFQTLAESWGHPYKKIDPLKLNLNLVTSTIPRNFALKHLVLPIHIEEKTLTIATPDPFNREVMEDITRVTNMQISIVISSKGDIIKLIDEFFGFKRSIAAAEDLFATTGVDLGNLEQYVKIKSDGDFTSNDQHIVNAVNHVFLYAFDQRASDIHIEPKREETRVRMRIDGVLHTVYKVPKKVHNALVTRIKALSRLNMAEKRKPQDGRIKTDRGDAEIEIRISMVPTAFGEKVVMRVMDPEVLFQDLVGLGFSDEDKERYNGFINLPHGMALVCGPTGSGKSTTLYSTLRQLSTPQNNVITVEDPIEMVHEDFNQIGIMPSAGVTFGNILRTILRQDPDIIMVGEMRDLETAQNAIQAALTGHLVLSTLHTNDAPTAITRLLDLGVQSFLIQATLAGIQAQRLVRTICSYCMESFTITGSELRVQGLDVGTDAELTLRRGMGCPQCRNTGYRGRTGIYEVIPYTEALRKLTTATTDIEVIRNQAIKEGMTTLRQSAIEKMMAGITTYQDVQRVTWETI